MFVLSFLSVQSRNLSEFLYLSLGRSSHKISPSSRERRPQNWRRQTMDDRDTKFNAVFNIFHEAESKA